MQLGFFGEHEHSIDAKGRISIPARFRDSFADGIILCRGLDSCITVYPPKEWEKMAEALVPQPIMRSNARRLSRTFFSSAFNTELDKQGRIVLPPSLRQYAEIGDDAVVVGVSNYMEIWSKERWEKERSAGVDEAWQIAEGMEIRS